MRRPDGSRWGAFTIAAAFTDHEPEKVGTVRAERDLDDVVRGLLAISRISGILYFGRPQDDEVTRGIVRQRRARVLALVKVPRYVPPPLQGTEGLSDDSSAPVSSSGCPSPGGAATKASNGSGAVSTRRESP